MATKDDEAKAKAAEAAGKLGGMSGAAVGYLKGRRGAIDDAEAKALGTQESGADGNSRPGYSKKY